MTSERRSLTLTEDQWQQLEQIAATTDSTATAGPTFGEHSWRALIRRLADGDLEISRRAAIRARLKQALRRIMFADEANACRVWKGHERDGYGWYYRPFNGSLVYLGEDESEALGTIERIREVA